MKHCTGLPVPVAFDSDTVQGVMLGAVERCFGH
ncbi:hypothetical protein M2407_005086 [Serratia sp. BIGb0234]|nr:hypothetical protein [Serratia sp. BIGb0234]